VLSFAGANDIAWVRFGKGEAKLEVMAPHLARQASTGRSGVAAIGVAQEFQRVQAAYEGRTSTGTPRWSFAKTDRRVTCYYFYLWDDRIRPRSGSTGMSGPSARRSGPGSGSPRCRRVRRL
jgi:hypothetical protein